MKEHITKFLDATFDARALSEKCRDYKDNKQWTEEQVQVLESRNQAAITLNRIKNKVQGLIGLYLSRRTDPKAYARTPKHEEASNAVSDALRYCKDKNKFDYQKIEAADNFFTEGYAAAMIDVDEKGDPLVEMIPWDRFYYDPHSRKKDFKDARYMGIIIWMSEEVFTDRWSSKKYHECLNQWGDADTFEDKTKFVDDDRQRIRIAQEFYLEKNVWKTKIFCGDIVLEKPIDSPYLDEEGAPANPIEAVTAYIDRDNNRFGEVKFFLDLQDEINHRRSSALAKLMHRVTISRQGAIEDVPKMKRELSKARGHVEYKGEKGDFDILKDNDMIDGQFALMQSSMQEMDASTFNAELAGQRQGELSGVAVEKLQAGGMLTTEELFVLLKNWEERVYTQMWWRILENWDEEKWVRVTDDHNNLRYVGFNIQVTLGQKLQELAEDEALPQLQRMQAAQIFQQLSQAQAPELMQPVEVSNPIPELDMDIIIEHSPDTINIQNEQHRMLSELIAARPDVPIKWWLETSQLRNKDQYVQELEQRQQQAIQAQQQQSERVEAREDAKAQASSTKDMAQAQHTMNDITTEKIKQALAVTNPPEVTSASL